MTETSIRRATPDDADTVAALGAETFSATFSHLYPPADLRAFLADSHSPKQARAYLEDPTMATWLMEADGAAVGYALAGPCALPHPEVAENCGELKRIYMLPAWRGGGRGSRLFDAALAWLEAHGRRPVWIGVWSMNVGAQRLYESRGFAKVGEYEFRVGQTLDREFILRRG